MAACGAHARPGSHNEGAVAVRSHAGRLDYPRQHRILAHQPGLPHRQWKRSMRRNAQNWVLTAACLTALIPAAVHAQADRYAPTVLQLAATPRSATFGSVTATRDIEAIFN